MRVTWGSFWQNDRQALLGCTAKNDEQDSLLEGSNRAG